MPRTARLVIPGVFHHVVNRGNGRQDVFVTDADRWAYLKWLRRFCHEFGLEVFGYCLMTNHVHLIVLPPTAESLGNGIGHAHGKYAQHFNSTHERTGHLWEGRYYSAPLDRPHFIRAMRYIERNPVRAGMVGAAWEYPWSSAAFHVGGRDPLQLLDTGRWTQLRGDLDWGQVLLKPESDEELARLRAHLSKGLPMGSEQFVTRIEKLAGRVLRPRRVGRPRRRRESDSG